MTSPRLRVVAAVIRAGDGRVLLAQRPQHKHQGGLWEFPGGKVEPGETEAEALQRELHEELGLWPTLFSPLIRIQHDYPDKSVELSVWQVTQWTGESYAHTAQGREGQPVAWVEPEALLSLPFPAANRAIVAAVRLPAVWRITPALKSMAELQAWAAARLSLGLGAAVDAREGWLLRLPEWPAHDYGLAAEWLQGFIDAAHEGGDSTPIALSLHGDPQVLQQVPSVASFHLSHQQVKQWLEAGVSLADQRTWPGQCFSAACHSPQELASATLLGVDSAWLSPVLPTPSHPGAPSLGWEQWAQCLAPAVLPVYALGGVAVSDLAQARLLGGQGVAGISQF